MKKFVIGVVAAAALLCAATAGAVAEKVFNLGVGDVIFVKGSNISCSIANPYKQMVCFKRTASGKAVAGSYGTAVSDKFAALVRFNAQGKPSVVTRKKN